MKELIHITEQNGQQVLSARELYDFLELNKSHWQRWYKKNIIDNPFCREFEDWEGFALMANGNETKDFSITIDFAKRLAMMARSGKGEQVRRYFIECERRLQQGTLATSLTDRIAKLEARVVTLERQLQKATPRPMPKVAQPKPDAEALVRKYFDAPNFDQDTLFLSATEIELRIRKAEFVPVGSKSLIQAVSKVTGQKSTSPYHSRLKRTKRGYWIQPIYAY